jgi:hypothetical protein
MSFSRRGRFLSAVRAYPEDKCQKVEGRSVAFTTFLLCRSFRINVSSQVFAPAYTQDGSSTTDLQLLYEGGSRSVAVITAACLCSLVDPLLWHSLGT